MGNVASRWSLVAPCAGVALLAATWSAKPGAVVSALVGILLVASVLAAVQHAEHLAHRIGEPYGALALAVAVTVIEVGLIVVLMVSKGTDTSTLARDTVFAAVMITCNGIVGASLLIGALRGGMASFNSEATATAFATVITLATLSLVLPEFTTSRPDGEFTPVQLGFVAAASVVLYLLFIFIQTIRHRDEYVLEGEEVPPEERDGHELPPLMRSLAFLVIALVAVVGLAKVFSPAIEDGVEALGAPQSAVGVVIALLVLAPEALTAVRNARRERIQVSFNLALGSAMASIGLTIPAIAIASIWVEGPLILGLESTQIVLLFLTAIVGAMTILPGRATLQEGGVHLVIFAAFLVLALSP